MGLIVTENTTLLVYFKTLGSNKYKRKTLSSFRLPVSFLREPIRSITLYGMYGTCINSRSLTGAKMAYKNGKVLRRSRFSKDLFLTTALKDLICGDSRRNDKIDTFKDWYKLHQKNNKLGG